MYIIMCRSIFNPILMYDIENEEGRKGNQVPILPNITK